MAYSNNQTADSFIGPSHPDAPLTGLAADSQHSEIQSLVTCYIGKLSNVKIHIWPNPIMPISTLKILPREGKRIRLAKLQDGQHIGVRSVYDHMISLARHVEAFLPLLNLRIDSVKLASCIAFHDLNEVLLGDIPEYSNIEKLSPGLEKAANDYIYQCLPDDLRHDFNLALSVIASEIEPEFSFFTMLDKTDPIIAIWRYLHHFRRLRADERFVDNFIEAMNDFFINPYIGERYCKNSASCFDQRIFNLICYFRHTQKARDYCLGVINVSDISLQTGLESSIIELLIEDRPMETVPRTM